MKIRAPRPLALLSTAFLVTALVGGAAFARGGGKTDAERTQARMERLERKVHERLAPKLGLDEATADRLVGVFQKAAEERKAAHKAVRAEREALRALVERKASDAEVKDQLARVKSAMAAMPRRGSLLDETAQFLTPSQQAKLLLASPKLFGGGKGHRGKHFKHRRGGDRAVEQPAEQPLER